jgi:transcriptional regulator with XRE-family HTH domain
MNIVMKKKMQQDPKQDNLDEFQQLQHLTLYIRELRFSHGMTQKELAGIAEVHYRTIQNIECGRQNYTIRNLIKVLSVFDLDFCSLISNFS